MNELGLIIVAIILFIFGYGIRPWIKKNYNEMLHTIDLIVMAVSISTILFPLIVAIQSGEIVVGAYIIIPPFLILFLIFYAIKYRKELDPKYRKTFIGLTVLYVYIFSASIVLMILFAPYMENIKL